MSERGLPCNVDAERSVLGSILLDDSFFPDTAANLQVDDFSTDRHRRIYLRMGEIYGRRQKIDRVTVAEEMQKHSELGGDGLTYLLSLDDGLPQVPSIDAYVRIVREKATLRRIIFTARDIAARAMLGTDTTEEIIESFRLASSQIADSGATGDRQPISTADLVSQVGVDALLSPRRHGEVRLPWPKLDAALSGFSGGQVIVVLGETSRGKTSFALQAAAAMTYHGKSALIWTMEMSPRSLFRRMVNQISGVPISSRTSQLTFQERDAHRLAVGHLAESPVYFDSHSRSVASFCASVRRVAQRASLGLVVVDYLQLIRSEGRRDNRAQQVSENSRNLKLAAMDFNLPIMVLSQVDRSSVKGKDAKIGLHSAKESGDVENDADVQLAIQAPQLSRDQDTQCAIEVQKQREGACGFSIPMAFRPTSQIFMEVQGND